MSSQVIVSLNEFLEQFPEFANTENTNLYFQRAQTFCSTYNSFNLQGDQRKLAIYYLTAHLLKLEDDIKNGKSTYQKTSASIGSVSVGTVPPPSNNNFKYWLNLTPYGQQLLFLLDTCCPLPILVGGSNIRVFQ